MGFSRQEHWSGLPLPPAGDLPNPETEHMSPESPALAERFFTTELPNPPPKCFLKNILNIPKKFLFSFIENWRKFLSPGGNLKNKFYWSLVDLQCYVSFRCTAKWISYTYTYIHSYFRFFPVPSIIEFWVELPVLYSRFLLVIYFVYYSVSMSIPIFQFIPPSLLSPGNH